jgi:hypothetical protein
MSDLRERIDQQQKIHDHLQDLLEQEKDHLYKGFVDWLRKGTAVSDAALGDLRKSLEMVTFLEDRVIRARRAMADLSILLQDELMDEGEEDDIRDA